MNVTIHWRDPFIGQVHALIVHDLQPFAGGSAWYAHAATACGITASQRLSEISAPIDCVVCLDALSPPFMREVERAALAAWAREPEAAPR